MKGLTTSVFAWLLTVAACMPVDKFNDVTTHREFLLPDESGQCIFVKSEEGEYTFISPGNEQVCGLYIIAEPELLVEFEFEDFHVSCNKEGLLSVIDGWELNGQFFPGNEDHSKPLEHRYVEFCGLSKPWKALRMSQNVGLLEFRLPTRGEGFTVTVRFRQNPKPCNAVLQRPDGVYTLRNYGRNINCSISIIFPESFRFLAASIGTQSRVSARNVEVETGLIRRCRKRGLEDYVEIRGGDGLDPGQMIVADEFCGLVSQLSERPIDVACGNSAVRLVSSGTYENSVTISFEMLLDLTSPTLVCPSLLGTL